MRKNLDWLKSRQEILRSIQQQIAVLAGGASPDLKRYQDSYQKEIRGAFRAVSMNKVIEECGRAKVVVSGDFHSLSHSQKIHLQVMSLLQEKRPIVLGVEFIEAKDQDVLNEYLKGKISEKSFLKRIDWLGRWGFFWHDYRPILEWARKNRVPVYGLNHHFRERTAKTLSLRDQRAAQILAGMQEEHPEKLIFVIFGELHLASAHLPRELIRKKVARANEIVRVLQNSDRHYVQLARQGRDGETEVIELQRGLFCVMNTPPWVKWQSYLMFLEKEYDAGLDGQIDYTDHIRQMISIISSDLDLRGKFEDFSVFTLEQKESPKSIRLTLAERRLFDYYQSHGMSFFLPASGVIFLGRTTLHHAARVAGYYLQARLSCRTHLPAKLPQDFIALIWLEMIGFFASKLINPKRKAETLDSLRAKLMAGSPKDHGTQAMKIALQQRLHEITSVYGIGPRKGKRRPGRWQSYVLAAQILGAMHGERLFEAFRRDRISAKTVVAWMHKDVEDSDFESFYFQVLRSVELVSSPKAKLQRRVPR